MRRMTSLGGATVKTLVAAGALLVCMVGTAEAKPGGKHGGGGTNGTVTSGGSTTSAPEIDPSTMMAGLGVVSGALALIAERRRRNPS